MKVLSRLSDPNLSSADFIVRLVIGVVLLNLFMGALAALSLYESRVQYEERAAVTTRNLSQVLEKDLALSFKMVDQALIAVANEVARQRAGRGIDGAALTVFISQQGEHLPELEGLRTADADGNVDYGIGFKKGMRANLANREYFIKLRDDKNAGLVISKPLVSRVTGRWEIVLARRLNNRDGSFGGVVYATIPLEHFSKAFFGLDVGRHGAVALRDQDLGLVARYPSAMKSSDVGLKNTAPELEARVRAGRNMGAYKGQPSIDGIERIYFFRQVSNYPFYLLVGLSTDEHLADWRNEVAKTGALVALFAMVTLLFSLLIFRGWKRQADIVESLRESEAQLQLSAKVFESSSEGIAITDADERILSVNRTFTAITGYSAEEAIGKTLRLLSSGRHDPDFFRRMWESLNQLGYWQGEVWNRRKNGEIYPEWLGISAVQGDKGKVSHYVSIFSDITERKSSEQRIEFLAYHDALTGLPNRILVQDRFEQARAHADRSRSKVALLFLDLDNFKTINDSLGHAVGDELLKQIASRLGECVRDSDTISRQGGDEFLIVLPELFDADATAPVLVKVMERLQDPLHAEGHELTTSVSIGVSIYPDDGEDFDTLLKKADMAMYRAKESGRNAYHFFDEQMNVEAVEHLAMRNGLRRAVERDEFVLHYQPQIDLKSGAVVGAEALIRWNNPEFGMISPTRFIPIAEESGLIVPIGEWVMHEACRQAMVWKKAGFPELLIGVNLSAVQFKRGDVLQTVISALEKSGFDPAFLELEITESILIQNVESVLATVKRLKLLGVKLSIDDFGTGYSSLSYLKRFDVDKLKIDQSFIRDLATDSDDAAIVRAIIQMAGSLNLKTIAEGVEDLATLEQLRLFKCDDAQGYHFARPMPAEEFSAYLSAQNRS